MSSGGPKVLDDLSRLAGGALGAVGGLRSEIEELVRQRVERVANELDLVTREDFEIAREMAAEARAENEVLTARLAVLEEQVADLTKAAAGGGTKASTGAKTARRKTGSGGKAASGGDAGSDSGSE
ncbi:accessory factor UbiK family protein [Roseospira navarrensis]|uniref:Accessory factor UbiK family protein n=1 Tax=Roseospira navarrensis TaxID=140058 RepID=A0A7X2D445_9PROT|nr:accessory factor UbiK family protein [Roseospira navarrensis]MQX36262.1 accessory factor UbiK family protein [Roseospira navarrensis]